jgi:hypothetical protein
MRKRKEVLSSSLPQRNANGKKVLFELRRMEISRSIDRVRPKEEAAITMHRDSLKSSGIFFFCQQ